MWVYNFTIYESPRGKVAKISVVLDFLN